MKTNTYDNWEQVLPMLTKDASEPQKTELLNRIITANAQVAQAEMYKIIESQKAVFSAPIQTTVKDVPIVRTFW